MVPLTHAGLDGAKIGPLSNLSEDATLAERWKEIDPGLTARASSPRPGPDGRVPLHPGAEQFYRDHEPRS